MFCISASLLAKNEGRLIFLLNDLSWDDGVQNILNLYQQNSATEKSLDIAAETIPKEIKSYKSTLNWPPNNQNLDLDQTVIPMDLKWFLCKLFHDRNSKNEIQVNSVGQDILYTVSMAAF